MQEMKYFNEGNDCDICKNQLMTGRDGTVEDCRRRQNGLSCRFEERDIRTCPVCEHEVDREDMYFTKDCHGIPFRLVCDRCYQRIMSKGYDEELFEICMNGDDAQFKKGITELQKAQNEYILQKERENG